MTPPRIESVKLGARLADCRGVTRHAVGFRISGSGTINATLYRSPNVGAWIALPTATNFLTKFGIARTAVGARVLAVLRRQSLAK